MALLPISLGITSNPGRAPAAGSALLLNCYAEKVGAEQKADWQLWASDGLLAWVTLPTGPIRAKIEVDGVLYVVAGKRIYKVTSSGDYTDIGGHPSTGFVTMARNRRPSPQIGIVASDGVYVVIDSDQAIPGWDPDLEPPTSIAFSDGYFVFSHADGRMSHTETDSAFVIDGLAEATAESHPDPIVRIMGLQSFILPFGKRSIEWWQDVGGDPFAFARSMAIQVGCAAAGSCAEVEQTIMFVADDRTVRLLQGHQAVRVSNHAVERAIASEADVSTLSATTWRARGHTFYALSGTGWTVIYDLTTGNWHNRASHLLSRWRVTSVTEFDGGLVAGDYETGALYRMGPDYADEAGSPLMCVIITPPVHAWPERLQMSRLYLDMIPGVGVSNYTAAGPAAIEWGGETVTWGGVPVTWGTSDESGDVHSGRPVVMMRVSHDGGHTWSSEREAEIGRQGQYTKRTIWNRLGSSRSGGATFSFAVSAAVMRGFLGATLDVEKLRA